MSDRTWIASVAGVLTFLLVRYRQHSAVLHAEFLGRLDGSGFALDTRRQHQYHDGTVSRFRGR